METPITLGKLIAKLEQRPPDNYLLFDFGGFAPESLHSDGSNHEQLVVSFARNFDLKVGDFLPTLKKAIGMAYVSYQQDDHRVHENMSIWVSNYGRSDHVMITDVRDFGRLSVLLTAFYAAQPSASHILPEQKKTEK